MSGGFCSFALVALLALGCQEGVKVPSGPDPGSLASAATRSENTPVPFYARIEQGVIIHDATWAAVVFYRPPSCVRAGFNLLDFFDIPAAFGCEPMTVAGFTVTKTPPLPAQSLLRGLGEVPVWFVDWSELQTAIADDVLTISELAALPSLRVGEASFYHETLHPTGGAKQNNLTLVGSGSLTGGGDFFLHSSEVEGELKNVRIDLP
ncbi:MAG TPA: hypothetical protein VFM44_04200 [Gemmatimonadota bacterium]|nr:hypothetical protein [Gemmatimonadota bacterium]